MPHAIRVPVVSSFYLDQEEETELVLRVQRQADRKAADRLVRAHLPLVMTTARKYFRYGVPMEDLIAEGNFGLLHALRKFDPGRGFRFRTYAQHWVRASMVGHVLKTWSLVSSGCQGLRTRWFFRLRRETARGAPRLDSAERAERELATLIGVKPDELRGLLQHVDARDLSLDAPTAVDSPQRFADILAAPDDPERAFLARQDDWSLTAAVTRAVATLDPRERYIVERRLMAEPDETLTLTDIGHTLGVSRERARQLQGRAAQKLRSRIASLGDAVVHESLAHKERAAGRRAPSGDSCRL